MPIHLILDNYGTHKHPDVREWFDKHPRYHLHFTSHRYRLTDLGLRTAWFFTRTYSRSLRPGLGTILPELSAATSPLRRRFDQLDRAVKSWIADAKLAA